MNNIIEAMNYFWLVVAIMFLLLEMGSPGLFFFLSFFFGGLAAAAATLWMSSIIAQTAVFFIGTIISLLLLRYFLMPLVEKHRPHERTNVYALQGKRGFVVIHISEKQSGMVKINGVTWAARCVHGDIINEGDEIEVVDIKGTHVIVKKFKQED